MAFRGTSEPSKALRRKQPQSTYRSEPSEAHTTKAGTSPPVGAVKGPAVISSSLSPLASAAAAAAAWRVIASAIAGRSSSVRKGSSRSRQSSKDSEAGTCGEVKERRGEHVHAAMQGLCSCTSRPEYRRSTVTAISAELHGGGR